MSGPWERIVVGLALACALMAPSTVAGQNRAALEAELERLRTDLRIPSMSAAVVEGGTVVWVRHFGIKPPPGDVVRYPIASLTKPFAAILALRDVERGRLTLDTAVSRPDGTRVQIRHLLSQTAAGMPGARFLYSSELYRLLGGPLASAAGTTLPVALAADVIRPLGLRHTIAGASVTASSGLESTVEDLARFAAALERGAVLSPLSLTEMFRPPRSPSGRAFPYALGWFVDQVGGEQVRWHFGQEQEVSGLMLMLPRRRLAFVVLARTDRLSAPFWLQFGDLRWSPAAAAFLAAWARIRLDLPEARRLMIQALIALAKGDRARGAALAKKASVLAPALINTADPALLAAFARSGERDLREMGRRTARRLLDIDPDHPRVLLDLAVLNLQDGQPAEAARLLRKILVDRQASPEIERTTKELLAEVGGRSP
jgi:CubicO group peptidase (beta-lactamase class C family)